VRALRQFERPEPRDFAVWVHGFDFDRVLVRARTRGRARYICARAYCEAGYGSIGDGFRHIFAVRLACVAPSARVIGVRDEGLLSDEGRPALEWSRP
jgi:hypothetical protein